MSGSLRHLTVNELIKNKIQIKKKLFKKKDKKKEPTDVI